MTAAVKETTLKNGEGEKKVYPPRNPVLRALQILYSIYALLVFIVLMLVVLVLVLLCTLLGKVRGGNAMYKVMNGWARVWCFCIGMWHKEIYEAPVDKSTQYIFVANRISYMDIPAAVLSIHQPIRILGKQEMVKYPIFGLIYRLAAISVDRTSAEGRARSVRALKAALAQHISIFIFPEGTFNETGEPLKGFYDGAFRIAIETRTPIKPLLFLDTHQRMHYRGFLELTPGITRTVYLADVPVDNYTMAQVKELKEKVHSIMEDGLRRYQKKYKQDEHIAVTK
jgi:1-acyl-sn-glycerol-3-phosphate acyltransferase